MASCPCHNDKTPSLSIKEIDGKILLKCFAGCEYKDLAKALNISYSNNKEPFNALSYISEKKNIPTSYLESLDIVSCGNELIIPYRYGNQKYARSRIRNCKNKSFRWENEKSEIVPYGIWKEQKDYCIIVEGESDCWTLWSCGFNAIGIPGSTMYKKLSLEHIKQFNALYIYEENDNAGIKFYKNLSKYIKEIGSTAKVYKIRTQYKDISKMYLSDPSFKESLQDILDELNYDDIIKKKDINIATRSNDFPIQMLPPSIKDYCESASISYQCDPAFFAIPILTILSSLVGSHKEIKIKEDWISHSSIYTALVADAGSGKSPALNAVKKFLIPIMEEQNIENKKQYRKYKRDMAKYKVLHKLFEQAIAKGEDVEPHDEPELQGNKKVFVDDITVESLKEVLSNNPRGVVLIKDEISSWINSHDQYKGGKGNDKEFFLEAWAGGSTVSDRKNKEEINIPKLSLAITGGIPPNELIKLQKHMDDGLIDRILLAFPKSQEKKWVETGIGFQLKESLQSLFLRLYHDDEKELWILDKEGREYFLDWWQDVEDQKDTASENMIGFLSKMTAHAARIALVLTLCDKYRKNKVCNVSHIASAIEIVEYFKKEREKFTKINDESKIDKQIRKLIDVMQRKKIKEISCRDITRSHIGGVKKTSEAKTLIIQASEKGLGIISNKKFILSQ